MKRYLFLVLACCPLFIEAADIPEIVNANRASSNQACIDNATNNCINSTCINSSSRSCPDDCQNRAENYCAGLKE